MGNLLGVYTIWYRDILRFWRDKMRMIGAITFPLLFLVVFGSGLSSSIGFMAPGVDFAKFMFPGVIGMTVLMTAFMSGISVVWDREFGFLKEVLVAPVSRGAVAVGKTLGGATVALIQGLMILIFAPIIGVSLSPVTVLKLIPLMFLLATALGAAGILLATRIRSMEAFQMTMQMLMFPMIFLSGVFFPLSGLPSWMNALVKLNPATYGIDPIRQVVLGSMPAAAAAPGALPPMPYGITLFGHTMSIAQNVGVVAVFAAVMVLLAMWSFQRQE